MRILFCLFAVTLLLSSCSDGLLDTNDLVYQNQLGVENKTDTDKSVTNCYGDIQFERRFSFSCGSDRMNFYYRVTADICGEFTGHEPEINPGIVHYYYTPQRRLHGGVPIRYLGGHGYGYANGFDYGDTETGRFQWTRQAGEERGYIAVRYDVYNTTEEDSCENTTLYYYYNCNSPSEGGTGI